MASYKPIVALPIDATTPMTNTCDEWLSDIGSGPNYKRKQFNRLMELIELGQVRRLIIAHRDRLGCFGREYFEAFCERHQTELVVIKVRP